MALSEEHFDGWVDRLAGLGIRIFQLSDTIGVDGPESIRYLFGNLIPAYPKLEFGAHFHTQPHKWKEKLPKFRWRE